jgi:hypothetical protein
MGEGSLTSKRVIWGGPGRQVLTSSLRWNTQLLQRLQVVPVCAPSSGIASRILIGRLLNLFSIDLMQ